MAFYDAFISYSHAKDKPIAAALQSVVQKLGKPWYRRRALRIFRDDTSLAATPHLWPTIERALGESRYFILLASPEAASSQWVNKEVKYWLDHNSIETLLVGLTDGQLAWSETACDFSWRGETPLPPVLRGRFQVEPKWVDLCVYREGAAKRDVKFGELAADFAAIIRGMPKEDLLSEEVWQQRRTLKLAITSAASLAALAIVATAAGILAYQARQRAVEAEHIAIDQKQIAEQERDRANKTLGAATKTADTLVKDLAIDFRSRSGMPVDLVRNILDRALGLQRELSVSGNESLGLRRSEAVAQQSVAETLLSLGDTANALTAAERSRDILEDMLAARYSAPSDQDMCKKGALKSLAGTECGNLSWSIRDFSWPQLLLGTDFDLLGNILKQAGRRDEAIASYRKAIELLEGFHAASPDDKIVQDNLALAYDDLGNTLEDEGDRGAAAEFYAKRRAVQQKISSDAPTSADEERALGRHYEETGDAALAASQRDPALEAYRKSIEIRKRLAAADEHSTDNQGALWLSQNKLGDALSKFSLFEQAIEIYTQALATIETLSATDPDNMSWQRDVVVACNRLGDALVSNNETAKASLVFQRGRDIIEKLVAKDSNNLMWKEDLALSYYKFGEIADEDERYDDAASAYGSSVKIEEQLSIADPGDPKWQSNVASCYEKLGDSLTAADRKGEDVAAYQKSLAVREQVVLRTPSNLDRRVDLAIVLVKLAQAGDDAKGRLTRALAIFREVPPGSSIGMRAAFWLSSAEQALEEMKE